MRYITIAGKKYIAAKRDTLPVELVENIKYTTSMNGVEYVLLRIE